MAHPMAPVPASSPPRFPHLHKTRVQLHPLTSLSHSLLLFPMIPAPCCLGPPPQSWGESVDPDMVSVSAAAAGSRGDWVTNTDRNKLSPATRLALRAVQMTGANPRKDVYIMWSDKNLHIGRAGSFYLFEWLEYLNGLLQSVASIAKEDCREITSQVRFRSFLPA